MGLAVAKRHPLDAVCSSLTPGLAVGVSIVGLPPTEVESKLDRMTKASCLECTCVTTILDTPVQPGWIGCRTSRLCKRPSLQNPKNFVRSPFHTTVRSSQNPLKWTQEHLPERHLASCCRPT
eukprot:scaffold310_cov335-Pavlova_lutheri.AAC.29